MKPLSDFSPRAMAWTSASVQRPQPVSVGIREKEPGAWARLFGVGLPGLLPDEFDLMQRANHGVKPAWLYPRNARDSGNAPRGHVS